MALLTLTRTFVTLIENHDNQLDLWGPVNVPKTLSDENKDAHETATM